MKKSVYLSLAVMVLLLMAGWTGYSQRPNPARSAWEYKSVWAGQTAFRGNEDLNELGNQGWELVAATSAGESSASLTPSSGGCSESEWAASSWLGPNNGMQRTRAIELPSAELNERSSLMPRVLRVTSALEKRCS